MTLIQAALLGLVQGLTEFLPVSSSGHLVILQKLFGFTHPPVTFDVLVHTATLGAIILVFREDIRKIDKKLTSAILVGSAPTALMGIWLSSMEDALFNSLSLVAIALLGTTVLLASSKYIKRVHRKERKNVDTKTALIIGAAQGLAIIPGISRSAATIVIGLWLGLDQRTAVRFSFLLAIPAILGAQLLKIDSLGSNQIATSALAIGFVIAVISGWISLKALRGIVERAKLHTFALYTLVLALLLLLVKF
ncbi:undecaprenyl-diphosphate phosphatase [Patescibacteria group bacterium]|nr:undecaprenyl-diphosphate phosphatase [Patescibacteria group bacterium]